MEKTVDVRQTDTVEKKSVVEHFSKCQFFRCVRWEGLKKSPFPWICQLALHIPDCLIVGFTNVTWRVEKETQFMFSDQAVCD